MLNLIFTRFTKVTALGFSTAFLVAGQNAVNAQQIPNLTPQQAQHLSRDLVPSSSQDFFRQGQYMMEREIQNLRTRQVESNEPVLKINSIPQVKKDRPPSKNPNILNN
ncbi:MAG: hypothetical protein RMY34_00780 [Aulosira sp. DedQUE10]|nr:hypothetical protein [Aulosira sp. DedQUE10]